MHDMGAFIQGDHALGHGGRRGDTGYGIPRRRDGRLHHPGVLGRVQLRDPARGQGDAIQRRESPFVPAVVQGIAVRSPTVDPHALHPGGIGQGGALDQHPPPARIRIQHDQAVPLPIRYDIGQPLPIRGVGGLKDRRIRVSRDQHFVCQPTAVRIDPGGLQPRAVPGHLRLVPFDPRDPLAVRVPGRLHVEIGAADQVDGPAAALAVDQGDDVDGFAGVDVDHPPSIPRHGGSGGRAESGRDRPGRSGGEGLSVQPAVLFGEDDEVIRHGEIAAPVSDAGPDRMPVRQVVRRLVAPAADEHPGIRALFQPDQAGAVADPLHVVERRAGPHGLCRDGALPVTVRDGNAFHVFTRCCRVDHSGRKRV